MNDTRRVCGTPITARERNYAPQIPRLGNPAGKQVMSDILTIDEVAALLKCKRSSVYELTRERSRARHAYPIPVLRLPFGLRFSRAAIEQWLSNVASLTTSLDAGTF
jgi:predicted DNA-binding transcriptional regulator AlpA